MGENSNQLAGLLSQLESFLTEKHGAQGNNLMEKIGSLKGVISDELHGKLSGVLSKLGGSDKLSSTSGLGGAGAIGSLLAGFLGGKKENSEDADSEDADSEDAGAEDDQEDIAPEHVDSVRGIFGELQSLFSGGNSSNEDQTDQANQTDEQQENGSEHEGSLLGNVLGSVLKSFTEK